MIFGGFNEAVEDDFAGDAVVGCDPKSEPGVVIKPGDDFCIFPCGQAKMGEI